MCSTAEKVEYTVIPILSLVKLAQQQHGLRHGDYQQYHQYISRKLRRVRKSLHFQQGNRSKVIPKKLTPEIMTDSRFITLSVFEIERSWAYAMQLKTESNTQLRKRFQMISRLHKAVSRAENLCTLIDDLEWLGAQTKLEIRAYKQSIHGILYFELQDWVKAKELLESAQAIYDVLLQMVDEDHQSIYKSRIDDLLPQIRYCAYTIGDETAASDLQRMRTEAPTHSGFLAELQLDQLLSQTKANQVNQVTEVDWMGTVIPVKSEKTKMAVLTVQESDVEIPKAEGYRAKLTIYESVLKSCVEAITSVRDELHAAVAHETTAIGDKSVAAIITTKSGKGMNSDKVSRLQILLAYLQYLKLVKTIDRTHLHIEVALTSGATEGLFVKNGLATSAYPKPQELSRLYDTIVQNFQELVTLPHLIQDHIGLKELLHTKIIANRSLRCYYLALAYNHGKKYIECSALLTRAKKLADQALVSLCSHVVTWNEVEECIASGIRPKHLIKLLNTLIQQADAEDLTCRAAYMLDSAETNASISSNISSTDVLLANKVLIDRLNYFMDVKVTEKSLQSSYPFTFLPPHFEAVPVKPIFFDLALNHINFPPLSDRVTHKPSNDKSANGLTGLVRGWFWGAPSDKPEQ